MPDMKLRAIIEAVDTGVAKKFEQIAEKQERVEWLSGAMAKGLPLSMRQFATAAGYGAGGMDRLRAATDYAALSAEAFRAKWGNVLALTSRIGTGMTVVGVASGVALAAAARSSISAASDLRETMDKMTVVFGAASEGVTKWAESAATAMGQSRQQAIETAATFGNLFLSVGLSQQEAAKLSMEMTQLGADLASFNNIPIDDALLRLRSGLVGEAEPMRRLGVLLSEEAVQQKAALMGMEKLGDEYSEAQKVLARYAIILDQTKTAQGNFALTSETVANQGRILAAQFANLRAAAGQALLPALTSLLNAFTPTLEKITAWAEKNPEAVAGFSRLAVGATLFNLTLAPILTNLEGIIAAARLARGALAWLRTASAAATAAAAAAEAGEVAVKSMTAGGSSIGRAIGLGLLRLGPWAAIAAAIGGALWLSIRTKQEEEKSRQAEEKTAGATLGAGTWIPNDSRIDPAKAQALGWQWGKRPGTKQEEYGWIIPEDKMPKPEEGKQGASIHGALSDEFLRSLHTPEASPSARRALEYAEGGRIWRSMKDKSVPMRPVKQPDKASKSGAFAEGTVQTTEDYLGDRWDTYIRILQQRVEWFEAEGNRPYELAAAQEELARGYDAYAAFLDRSGKHLEATDKRIAAIRERSELRRQAKADAEQGKPGAIPFAPETWRLIGAGRIAEFESSSGRRRRVSTQHNTFVIKAEGMESHKVAEAIAQRIRDDLRLAGAA